MVTSCRLSLADLLWCGGQVPCCESDANGKATSRTTGYIVEKGGRLVGRATECTATGEDQKLVYVTRDSVSRGRYLFMNGAGKRRWRGEQGYTHIEAQIEEATKEAEASPPEDKARAWKRVHKLRKQRQKNGWRPAPVSALYRQLQELSLRKAMTEGVQETKRCAAARLYLTLHPKQAYWPWATSGTARQAAFEHHKANSNGIQDLIELIAPCNAEVETMLVVGHWVAGPARRGAPCRSPVQRFRRAASRQRTLAVLNESCSSCRCPLCHARKDMVHETGRVKRGRKAAAALLQRRKKEFNRKRGKVDSARIPSKLYHRLKDQAQYQRRRIHGSSVCRCCFGTDPVDKPRRTWSRDHAAAMNLCRLIHAILTDNGQRPMDLRARQDLGEDGGVPAGAAQAGSA